MKIQTKCCRNFKIEKKCYFEDVWCQTQINSLIQNNYFLHLVACIQLFEWKCKNTWIFHDCNYMALDCILLARPRPPSDVTSSLLLVTSLANCNIQRVSELWKIQYLYPLCQALINFEQVQWPWVEACLRQRKE